MRNDDGIGTYTEADLAARRARGESRTDLERLTAMSEAELERQIAADPDFAAVPTDWYESAVARVPTPKKLVSLRLDAEVIDWFKRQGPGYQTRMNAVLRAFVDHNSSKPDVPR